MEQVSAALSDEVIAREPLGSAGASGNTLERVTLRDERRLIRKEASQEWDWISRATHDDGRVVLMWPRALDTGIPPRLLLGSDGVRRRP